MKKMLSLAVATLLLSAPSLFSQQVPINEKGLQKKIERSDADIVNPKKSGNANTWIFRGEAFFEAATEVSKNLYDGIDANTVVAMFGMPIGDEVVQIGNKFYAKGIFPYVDVYMDELGLPVSWVITKEIYPNALAKSAESFSKAYELGGTNAKTAEKIAEGFKKVYDEYSKTGALYYALSMFNEAGDQFVSAYKVSQLPGATIAASSISTLLHDAGLAYLFGHEYTKSAQYLTLAEKSGYNAAEIYYLIYHAYRGTAETDVNAIKTGKEYLEKGMAMYPSDANIIESLSEAYVLLGEDPKQILTSVEKAAAANPDNADMWSALGVLYTSMEDYDNAINAFGNMVRLMPDSYLANNNMGIVYIKKADMVLNDVNARAATFSSRAEADAEKAKAFEVYAQAIPYLEKATEIDPTNMGTLELLKNVTFRIREMEGMQAKYDKYAAMLKGLN